MKAWIWALCLTCIIPYGLQAQSTDSSSKAYFLTAKAHIENMLNGKAALSYEDAIYYIEDAWYDGKVDYTAYKKVISSNVANISNMMELLRDSARMHPEFDAFATVPHEQRIAHYQNALANYAIYKYITDTTFPLRIENKSFIVHHPSFDYAYADPLGTKDWTTTHVTHLLTEQKGNCFALASLFKIFSERLQSEATLNTAPSHIYISHKDDKGTKYNVELSTRSFPGAGTIETLTHSPREAVKNDISLRALDLKQSVALTLVYLAKGYEYKYGIKDDDFLLSCSQSVLSYDSLNLNAMLLKAEVLESRLLLQNKNITQLQKQEDFKQYQNWIKHIYSLGYREMPYEMKNVLVQGWARDSVLQLKEQDHTPKGKYQTRYAGLSWGMFDEEIHTKPLERYSRTIFDTKNQSIAAFVENDVLYKEYDFDPVVFAMSVDPLAHKFPHTSPYNFVDNNPILKIDPDGRDWIVSTYKDKSGKTKINLTYAAAVINSSGKNIDMSKYIANEVQNFEKVFGQGNVNASLHLREISSVKELSWHESLIEMLPGSVFGKKLTGGDSRLGGKYIRINADLVGLDGVIRDRKTTVHEIGHTGGLLHPFEFEEKVDGNFLNGSPFDIGVQKYYNSENSMELEANFMNYTEEAMKSYPMVPESRLQTYFESTIGPATQGQTQTIINNLHKGNLNSDKDIPEK